MIRFIILTTGVVLVVVLGFLIDAQSRPPVLCPPGEPGQPAIYALGRVEGATAEVELRPQLAGRVVEILVAEGQVVEQGAVLLRLDDAQYRHEVALAAAELSAAEAQLARRKAGARSHERAEAAALYRAKVAELERAQLTWKRVRELRESRAVAQQDADNQRTLVSALTAEAEAAKARHELLEAPARSEDIDWDNARIAAAKARLELAKVQLERTELKASGRGQVLKLDVELGELVGPTSAEPAVILADTTNFLVRAFVEETDAPRVKAGMTARIRADGLPGKELTGRVTRLSPRMDRKQLWSDQPSERYDTKTREVWIELDGGESLVVGLRVDAMIDARSEREKAGEHADIAARTAATVGPTERRDNAP